MLSLLQRNAVILLIAVATSFLMVSPVDAQTQGEGSIYSYYGLGELRNYSSSQAQALGGGAFAARSVNYINLENPATWGEQVFTRFNAGFRFTGIEARNAEGNRSELSEGSVGTASFSFPIVTGQLGFAVTYQPYSRSNYRVTLNQEMRPDPARPDSLLAYQTNLEGSGGLQEVKGGFGYRFNDFLSVGASINAIFGIIEGNRRINFAGGGFAETLRTQGTRLSGVTGTVGSQLSLTDVLADDDILSLGGSFTLPTSLTGTQTTTLGRDLDRDTLRTEEGSVDLPWSSTLGLAYQPDARWTIVIDGQYAPWSEASNTFTLGQALPGTSPISDRMRVSGGIEHVPAGNQSGQGYLRRVAYRLGGFYEQTYTLMPTVSGSGTDTPRNSIHTSGVTGGLSLPTLLPGTRIDIGLEAGIRGTTENNLVQDRFIGVSVTVNAGERWFQRRRFN